MDEQYKKLLGAVYKYLSFRQRSEKEIHDYLTKKKADDLTLQKIIAVLKKQNFLNDEDFAKSWIESRSKKKAWRVLKLELKQKGISEDIIQIFEETTQKQDNSSALKLAGKKLEKLKNESLQKKKEKIFRFLSSKGFDYDTIKEVVDRLFVK